MSHAEITPEDREDIHDALSSLQYSIHAYAKEKGWWDTERNLPETIALMHRELSEALEELRTGKLTTDVYHEPDGKPCGFGVELADVIIRVLDTAEHEGICIGCLLLEKHAFNLTRAHRHGGKTA